MLQPRIIPCLLMKRDGLVKTVQFRSPKYVGDPINAVRIFNEKQVDELVVLDIDATVEGREPDYRRIEMLASECRMPLCYGGGVTTLEQAKRIVGLGVEKVAFSSAAVARAELIEELAAEIGKQSVVVVLDVRAGKLPGAYEVWTHNGTVNTGRCPFSVAREMQARGAGEIVVNSIDRDGVMQGYDLHLARTMTESVRMPVTILGGAGKLDHLRDLIAACGIVGASAGSLFVFKGSLKAVLISYPDRERREALVRAASGVSPGE
jgi:imidazole glycerol-phosphate synthase subunit HisF